LARTLRHDGGGALVSGAVQELPGPERFTFFDGVSVRGGECPAGGLGETGGTMAMGQSLGSAKRPVGIETMAQPLAGRSAAKLAGKRQSVDGGRSLADGLAIDRAGRTAGSEGLEDADRRTVGAGYHVATTRPSAQRAKKIILIHFTLSVFECRPGVVAW